LMQRLGRQAGTKEMIGLLQLGRTSGMARVRAAIEQALALGCGDSAAVRHLLTAPDLARAPSTLLEVGDLARFDRPLPSVADYDQLLARGAVQ